MAWANHPEGLARCRPERSEGPLEPSNRTERSPDAVRQRIGPCGSSAQRVLRFAQDDRSCLLRRCVHPIALRAGSRHRPDSRVRGLADVLHLVEIGAVALRFHAIAGDEPERRRIDAVAQAAAILRTFVENMTEVAVAEFRAYLRANHAVARVGQLLHMGMLDRLGETGPAAPGLELVRGGEERLAGDDIDIDTGLLVVEERTRAGALRAA